MARVSRSCGRRSKAAERPIRSAERRGHHSPRARPTTSERAMGGAGRGTRSRLRPARRGWGSGGPVRRRHRGPPRLARDRRREGPGPRRRDGLVGRLDVGAVEPAVAGRRASWRTSTSPAPTSSTRSARTTTSPASRRCWRTAAHGGLLRKAHLAAVRERHLDRRHPGRPARRRHRRTVRRPEADQRTPAEQGAAGQAAPPALRDLVPRHGHHGRSAICRPSCTRPRRCARSSTRAGGWASTCST